MLRAVRHDECMLLAAPKKTRVGETIARSLAQLASRRWPQKRTERRSSKVYATDALTSTHAPRRSAPRRRWAMSSTSTCRISCPDLRKHQSHRKATPAPLPPPFCLQRLHLMAKTPRPTAWIAATQARISMNTTCLIR